MRITRSPQDANAPGWKDTSQLTVGDIVDPTGLGWARILIDVTSKLSAPDGGVHYAASGLLLTPVDFRDPRFAAHFPFLYTEVPDPRPGRTQRFTGRWPIEGSDRSR